MAVVFSRVFSCCLQRKHSKTRIPDEESHLIPANTEIASIDTGVNFIRDRMKERMLHIVREKESKMVNVASRMLFNLDYKSVSLTPQDGERRPLAGPSVFPPTYSRSESASSLPQHIRVYTRSPLSPHSVTRSNLNHSVSRSSSMTFLHDDDHATTSGDYDNGDGEHSGSGSRARTRALRPPAFNIRLVRGILLHPHAEGSEPRRGRTKRKAGSGKVESPSSSIRGSCTTSQKANNPAGLEVGGPTEQNSNASVGQEPLHLPPLSANEVQVGPVFSISPASTTDFMLRDTGPLVVGWDV